MMMRRLARQQQKFSSSSHAFAQESAAVAGAHRSTAPRALQQSVHFPRLLDGQTNENRDRRREEEEMIPNLAMRDRITRWQRDMSSSSPLPQANGGEEGGGGVGTRVNAVLRSFAPGGETLAKRVATKEAIEIVDAGVVGRKAVAARDLSIGTIINEFYQPVFDHPTMHTVCLSEGVHVAPTEGAEFISHACTDTNCRVVVSPDGKVGRVTITKPVRKGEDFSFNYNTTEWIMSCPFTCLCSSCRKLGAPRRVAGFSSLSHEERLRIYGETSPYVRGLADAEAKANVMKAQ